MDINSLPEDCIANILSLTSPMDVCRLSAVAPTFCAAALSDAVWERLLPSDYRQIMSRSFDVDHVSLLNSSRSRKDLYMYLCDNPILIDEGRKSFWLDKRSGKKCYMVAARDLSIAWGDTTTYWRWISLPESRFAEAGELIIVCWLEIWGKINVSMLSPGTTYAAYLVYDSRSMLRGFRNNPVETTVYMNDQEWKENMVSLEQPRPDTQNDNPKQRVDGWMEVELGELFVVGGEDGDFVMGLKEVKTGNGKKGLIVQGIEIRTKESS